MWAITLTQCDSHCNQGIQKGLWENWEKDTEVTGRRPRLLGSIMITWWETPCHNKRLLCFLHIIMGHWEYCSPVAAELHSLHKKEILQTSSKGSEIGLCSLTVCDYPQHLHPCLTKLVSNQVIHFILKHSSPKNHWNAGSSFARIKHKIWSWPQ